MSKSKQNVIDPSSIIDKYGADTARWFMMSDSPPDRDLEWTETGVEGSFRFINKVWKFANEINKERNDDDKKLFENDKIFLKELNLYIAKITDNIEKFHFNKVIANIYELTNFAQKQYDTKKVNKKTLDEFINTYAKLIHPVVPHLSEEIWKLFKNKGMVINESWPLSKNIEADLSNIKIKIALQINGKTKLIMDIDEKANQKDVEKIAFKDKRVLKYLENKKPKRIVFVPKKIINIVI